MYCEECNIFHSSVIDYSSAYIVISSWHVCRHRQSDTATLATMQSTGASSSNCVA